LTKKNYVIIKFSNIWTKKYFEKFKKTLLSISHNYYEKQYKEINLLFVSQLNIDYVDRINKKLKLIATIFEKEIQINGIIPISKIYADAHFGIRVRIDKRRIFDINMYIGKDMCKSVIIEEETHRTREVIIETEAFWNRNY